MFSFKTKDKVCISIKEAVKINKKWKELNYELSLLREENENLKNQINFLKKIVEKQEKEIKDLSKDEPFFQKIDKLKEANKELERENRILSSRNQTLQKVNLSLYKTLNEAEEKIEALLKENTLLKKVLYERRQKKMNIKTTNKKKSLSINTNFNNTDKSSCKKNNGEKCTVFNKREIFDIKI